ncbi:MAG: hypothetical protein JWP32_1472 [Schumannella sp.]|jgi:hypothetical protein|nr:hypothetical protein [Schumannella sp.]
MKIALPLVALAVLLTGCATPAITPGASSDGSSSDASGIGVAIAAPGDVVGQGTVIQTADAAPQLCLGAVAESYPPQCTGPEVTGWDWAAVDGEETSGDVTWGAYAVTGGWDGTRFSEKSAIMLALYDPMPFIDPLLDPENAGDTEQAELERIQTELTESAPFLVLTSSIENGYLFASVLYDDGSIQAWADQKYLPDTIAIRPALRDVE